MRRRRITAELLAAGFLGMVPCAAMGDAPARSAALCQTLHASVQPALAGLMKNDGLLEAANRALVSGNVDRGSLHGATQSLTHNLTIVRQLLGQKLQEDANSTSRASQDLMKARLEAVVSAQNDALNVIQGYLQADETAHAHSQVPGEHQADPNQVAGGFNDDLGLHDDFHNAIDPAKPIVETRIGSPARLLEISRSQIGDLEDSAGLVIMSVVKVCNSQ